MVVHFPFLVWSPQKNQKKYHCILLQEKKIPLFIFLSPAVYFNALKMCSQIRLISACISPSWAVTAITASFSGITMIN